MFIISKSSEKFVPLLLNWNTWQSVLNLQEQALHAVHSIVMLVDKDTSPRPEKQPGLQVRKENNFCVLRSLSFFIRFDTADEWCFSFMPNFAFVFIYKMDTVTSMKALNKTVEASQLTSDLGGTFAYSHTDWLQFHQVLNSHPVFTGPLQPWYHILQSVWWTVEFPVDSEEQFTPRG